MRTTKTLRLRLDFSTLPKDWRVTNVCIDWDGEPLVLMEEGRPSAPARNAGIDSVLGWLNTPPNAHVLLHWKGGSAQSLRVENRLNLRTTQHVQPFEDGWLLGEARCGNARILDPKGQVLRSLDLGDASQHVQTSRDGRIWVGYFDEGVFGRGIGQSGLVCFDPMGRPIFRYAELAAEHDLPHIADCYTLNVADDSVLVCYYTDFPLVRLVDFRLDRVWREFAAISAIAVRKDNFIAFPSHGRPYLLSRSFESSDQETWELADPEGNSLSLLTGDDSDIAAGYGTVPFRVAARSARLYVWDEHRLYELP